MNKYCTFAKFLQLNQILYSETIALHKFQIQILNLIKKNTTAITVTMWIFLPVVVIAQIHEENNSLMYYE